jgi:hypothetical protein
VTSSPVTDVETLARIKALVIPPAGLGKGQHYGDDAPKVRC